jgi:hypothetical protein
MSKHFSGKFAQSLLASGWHVEKSGDMISKQVTRKLAVIVYNDGEWRVVQSQVAVKSGVGSDLPIAVVNSLIALAQILEAKLQG